MNLAPKQPAIVAQLAKQMATYKPVRQTDCPEPVHEPKRGKQSLSVRNGFLLTGTVGCCPAVRGEGYERCGAEQVRVPHDGGLPERALRLVVG